MSAQGEHDFEAQRADTLSVFRDIAGRTRIPAHIRLELQFVPDRDPDWPGVRDALAKAGFETDRYENSGAETLEAAIDLAAPSGEAIWTEEERATRICFNHGFRPDGWGFRA